MTQQTPTPVIMTPPVVHPLDVSFVLAVTAAAMLWPPLALAVGAAYFGLSAWLSRRAEPAAAEGTA